MYARGPGLKQGYISKPLMMTDHYNLICHLLDVEGQANNGSWLRVQGMLEESADNPSLVSNQLNSGAMTINCLPSNLLTFVIFIVISCTPLRSL